LKPLSTSKMAPSTSTESSRIKCIYSTLQCLSIMQSLSVTTHTNSFTIPYTMVQKCLYLILRLRRPQNWAPFNFPRTWTPKNHRVPVVGQTGAPSTCWTGTIRDQNVQSPQLQCQSALSLTAIAARSIFMLTNLIGLSP
jgi:hypothetical protein